MLLWNWPCPPSSRWRNWASPPRWTRGRSAQAWNQDSHRCRDHCRYSSSSLYNKNRLQGNRLLLSTRGSLVVEISSLLFLLLLFLFVVICCYVVTNEYQRHLYAYAFASCFLVVTYRWHWVGWSLNWWCGWVRTLDTHTVRRHWLPRPGSSGRTRTSPRPPAPSPGCPGSCSGCSAPAGAGSHPARCASTRKPDKSRLYCDFLRKWTTRKYILLESQALPGLGLGYGCAVQFYFFDAQPQVNFNLAELRIVISFCMYGSRIRAKINIRESWLIIII